ncbi:MAG: shikimate kinase, partial [Planctomycetota bacterium]
MAAELAKLGAEVEELPDGLVIHGRAGGANLVPASVHGCGDHRIVMAMSIAAMALPGENRHRRSHEHNLSRIRNTDEPARRRHEAKRLKHKDYRMKIVISGPKGAGKTSVAKVLSEKLGLSAIETDTLIETAFQSHQDHHHSCREIFIEHGEA